MTFADVTMTAPFTASLSLEILVRLLEMGDKYRQNNSPHQAIEVYFELAEKYNDTDEGRRALDRLQEIASLVELLRELLERQAIRRIEAESLTDAEVERLGVTFLQLSEQMDRLKKEFGVKDEDLNIDLGPLGKLL